MTQHTLARSARAGAVTERAQMAARPDAWSFRAGDRGRAIHQLIGELLLATRRPTPDAIRRTLSNHALLESQSIIHAQAIKQALSSALTVYFTRFAPSDVWDFAGYSVRIRGCEFDLLWRDSRTGRILADELKTSVLGLRFGAERLDRQAARQLRAGSAAIGERFAGVRAIVLADPSCSFLARPDGTREPLNWEVI
jgi:hypothetical protein